MSIYRSQKKIKKKGCVYCGESTRVIINIDHIFERQDGGHSFTSNLQPTCYNCHHIKTFLFHTLRCKKWKLDEQTSIIANAIIRTYYRKNKRYIKPEDLLSLLEKVLGEKGK